MKIRAYLCAILCLAAGGVWGQAPHQLWTQTTIYRDAWGVPHVYAENPRAMAFAFGYAQAEDRLETLMRAYRIATGRAAAVFGPDYADSDAFALMLGHGELAEQAFESAPPLTRDLCEGFALGVNAWIADHPARVPDWADGARPTDVLALMHCYLMSFAPFDLPGVFRRDAPSFSGNAWALGPPRTQSGAPVLVINPHGYYDAPFQWYEAHLVAPGMNVAGATLCGLPVILQGHNEVLGWALTPNYPDFADIYIQPEEGIDLPAADPNKMQLEALLERLLIGRRLVETRTYFVNTPSGLRQRSVPFRLTPRGPVVGEFNGESCSLMVGGYADFGTLEQLAEMAAARNLGEFQDALSMRQLPCFHIVYADREGNLFYLYNVKVGDKSLPPMALQEALNREEEALPGGDPFYVWDEPVRANDSRYAWGELVPLEALPAFVNPPAGYLQACGTPPWAVTGDSGIDPAAVPDWLAHDRDSFRAQRVRHLLSMGKRSFPETQAMLYDVLVPFATAAVPQVLAWADQKEGFLQRAHPDAAASLEVLRSWNYVADTASPGMTVFNAWWTAYRQLSGPDLPDAVHYQEFMSAAPQVQELALEAVSNAAREMRNLHDAIEVPWGEVHRLRRGRYEEPIAGGLAGEPIMTAGGYGAARRKLLAGYGYAYAMAVQFGETPESVSVLPGGASEDPSSDHFADQLKLFSERRFKVNDFLDSDVQRYAESAYGRRPTLRPVGMQAVFGIDAREPVTVHLEAVAEPPAPLPDGMTTYSVFVTPVVDASRVPLTIDAAIYIPPSVVEEGGLDRLAVYVLHPDHGWLKAPEQRLNGETRIFRARYEDTFTCAVLGPAVLRIRPTAPVEMAATSEEAQPAVLEETAAQAEANEASSSETAPAPADPVTAGKPMEEPIQPESTSFVEPGAVAEKLSVPEGAARSGLAWGKTLEIVIPASAGTVRIEGRDSLGAFTSASMAAPAPLPSGLIAVTPFVGVHCSDASLATRIEVALALSSEMTGGLSALSLYAYHADRGWRELPDQRFDAETKAFAGSDTQPGVYAVLSSGGPSESPPPSLSQDPAVAREGTEDDEAAAEPETVDTPMPAQPAAPPVQGPRKPTLAWGKSLELAAEGTNARFTIEADSSIGAFAKVATEPPAPIPQGLRTYTSFVTLSFSNQNVPARIGITMSPENALADGVDISALQLYAYEADTGWVSVPEQERDSASGTFRAPDTRPRTYAILGLPGGAE